MNDIIPQNASGCFVGETINSEITRELNTVASGRDVGPGKKSKINKHRAYVYSGL